MRQFTGRKSRTNSFNKADVPGWEWSYDVNELAKELAKKNGVDEMKKKIPQTIKTVLTDVKRSLKKIYGETLKDIILYGSYARGDFTEGSDIDLIILLRDMKEPIAERKKYFDAIWELDLKYDTVISIIPLREDEYRTRKLPLILNAKQEGFSI